MRGLGPADPKYPFTSTALPLIRKQWEQAIGAGIIASSFHITTWCSVSRKIQEMSTEQRRCVWS